MAATRGDGLGYDIESFNRDGSARVIEEGRANELRVSQQRPRDYHLYLRLQLRLSPAHVSADGRARPGLPARAAVVCGAGGVRGQRAGGVESGQR